MNDIYVEPKEYFTEEMLRILEGKDKVSEAKTKPEKNNKKKEPKKSKEK